jgi:hypothetical protein
VIFPSCGRSLEYWNWNDRLLQTIPLRVAAGFPESGPHCWRAALQTSVAFVAWLVGA